MRAHGAWLVAVTLGALTFFTTAMPPAAAQEPAAQQPAVGGAPAPLELPPLPRNAPPPQRFGDWAKRCDVKPGGQAQQCHLTQILTHTRNDKRQGILMVRVGYFGEKKTPVIIMQVPLALGVYLPTGLILNVPGADPLKLVLETCLPRGCHGVTKLPSAMVSAMKNAAKGTVTIRTIRRKQINLPVSFKGITAGLASLDKS